MGTTGVVMRSQKRLDPFAVFYYDPYQKQTGVDQPLSGGYQDITENKNHKRITRHGSGQATGWDQDGIRINNQRGRRRRISRGKAVQDHIQNKSQSKRSEMSDKTLRWRRVRVWLIYIYI